MEEIVEVMQIRTQERVQSRTVKQIVLVHSIPLERIPVEQIVDMQEPQVMEKTSRVPKITQQVVYTQYHSARNLFERFRGFWELISRFEFEFCRCGNYFFLKDSNFLVRSCECAVACLCPHNSILNVVASAIHDDKYIHFNETIVERRTNRSLLLALGAERQIEH